MRAKELGAAGEEAAARFLAAKGYMILTRGYRKRGGEIDLIARDGQYLVFVEVKSRHNRKYGDPIEAVNKYKQKHIRYCANLYLSSHRITDQSVRFDVVEVLASAGRAVRYRHTRNAF